MHNNKQRMKGRLRPKRKRQGMSEGRSLFLKGGLNSYPSWGREALCEEGEVELGKGGVRILACPYAEPQGKKKNGSRGGGGKGYSEEGRSENLHKRSNPERESKRHICVAKGGSSTLLIGKKEALIS